jgi:phage baseplate assembly protein W
MASINIKFPVRDDVTKNTFLQRTSISKDAFSSDLLLLLLTERGERYYQPDYGTNLLKYIFEQNDQLTALEVEKEIKRTVSKYIPSLTINKVEFNWLYDDQGNPISENQLNVKVKFTYSEDAFNESGELDLNF